MNENSKVWAIVGYLCIVFTLIGQIVMGGSYILGQACFMVSNVLFLTRTFCLKRPLADKVKDVCFTAVTAGLIIWYFIR